MMEVRPCQALLNLLTPSYRFHLLDMCISLGKIRSTLILKSMSMGLVQFDLVLPEIQEAVGEDEFTYLVATLRNSILDLTQSQSDSGPFMGSVKDLFYPLEREEIGSISEDRINLSSLKRSQRSAQPTHIPCSHLPVCRKIISKIAFKYTTIGYSKQSNSSSLNLQRKKSRISEPGEDLTLLIGKISYPMVPSTSSLHARKSKIDKGVLDLTHSICNPLYKDYNPKGLIKSEDEKTREFIQNLVIQFNSWLQTLEGDIVQVDSQVLIKIVRDDLEIPDSSELENIERVIRLPTERKN